jgi:hypothetical protein
MAKRRKPKLKPKTKSKEVSSKEISKESVKKETKSTFAPPSRIKEKEPGFGVIKAVAGIIIALIVGVSILANVTGAPQVERGDLMQGEICKASSDCVSGHICYPFKDEPFKCLQLCRKTSDCETGYTCTPVAKQGRKRVIIKDVCIENAKLR